MIKNIMQKKTLPNIFFEYTTPSHEWFNNQLLKCTVSLDGVDFFGLKVQYGGNNPIQILRFVYVFYCSNQYSEFLYDTAIEIRDACLNCSTHLILLYFPLILRNHL